MRVAAMDPMVLLAVLRRMVPRDLMVDRTVPLDLRQQATGQPVRQEAAVRLGAADQRD